LRENILEKRPNQNTKPGEGRPQGPGNGQPAGGRRTGQKKKRRPSGKKKGAPQVAQAATPPVKQHDYSVYPAKPAKKYSFTFFETFAEARSHAREILDACQHCDQLNVVIRAEGDMNDPELVRINPKVKVFAGAAWTLIHERRVEEKWYDASH
jgi:hypothetical protein